MAVSYSTLVANIALVSLLVITVLTLRLDIASTLVFSTLIVLFSLRIMRMVQRANRPSGKDCA